jgi:hypothetical protein
MPLVAVRQQWGHSTSASAGFNIEGSGAGDGLGVVVLAIWDIGREWYNSAFIELAIELVTAIC